MNGEYIIENEEEETVHLTKLEFNGLKALIQYLSRSKSLVDGISDQKSLLNEAKLMIEDHKDDDAELAITGHPVVIGGDRWWAVVIGGGDESGRWCRSWRDSRLRRVGSPRAIGANDGKGPASICGSKVILAGRGNFELVMILIVRNFNKSKN